MSTIAMCGKCGGAVVGPGESHYGRRCTCSTSGGAAVATATMSHSDNATTLTGGRKLCCKCGADVTGDRRMKDHLGRYWCYECGAADQAKRGQGVSMLCPDCKKHFRPTKMMKVREQYVCEACYEARQNRKGLFGNARKAQSGERKGSGVGLLLAILAIGAAAAFCALYAMDMFP